MTTPQLHHRLGHNPVLVLEHAGWHGGKALEALVEMHWKTFSNSPPNPAHRCPVDKSLWLQTSFQGSVANLYSGVDGASEDMAGEFSASNPRYTASVAVYRNRPSEKFKSRSALARFSDVIDQFARKRHGHLWECPISDIGPMRLPKTREQATDIEQHYAYSLLKREYPGLEFPEIIDLNDSVPSLLRRECPELDIDADFWKKAISLADQAYERQLTFFDELRDTLEHFAQLAYNENVKCMAYNENTHVKQNIDARFWEVDEDALVARYWSSSIVIPEQGNNFRYLILVDTNSFSPSKLLIAPDYAQRELIVRERLREAKTISEKIPPYGTIGKLRSIICKHLACDPQQAVAIINAETGGCWSNRGLKKEYDKIHVKQIEIVLEDAV